MAFASHLVGASYVHEGEAVRPVQGAFGGPVEHCHFDTYEVVGHVFQVAEAVFDFFAAVVVGIVGVVVAHWMEVDKH